MVVGIANTMQYYCYNIGYSWYHKKKKKIESHKRARVRKCGVFNTAEHMTRVPGQ